MIQARRINGLRWVNSGDGSLDMSRHSRSTMWLLGPFNAKFTTKLLHNAKGGEDTMKTSVGVRPRCVRLEKSRLGQSKPYRAKITVDGKSRDLGRYATRKEAEAVCRAVRKVIPAKVKTAPPVSETIQKAIRSDLNMTSGLLGVSVVSRAGSSDFGC
jgi:hypothetical protein